MHKMQVKSAAALVQLLNHSEFPQSPAVNMPATESAMYA
jgi:hypothetical protein